MTKCIHSLQPEFPHDYLELWPPSDHQHPHPHRFWINSLFPELRHHPQTSTLHLQDQSNPLLTFWWHYKLCYPLRCQPSAPFFLRRQANCHILHNSIGSKLYHSAGTQLAHSLQSIDWLGIGQYQVLLSITDWLLDVTRDSSHGSALIQPSNSNSNSNSTCCSESFLCWRSSFCLSF